MCVVTVPPSATLSLLTGWRCTRMPNVQEARRDLQSDWNQPSWLCLTIIVILCTDSLQGLSQRAIVSVCYEHSGWNIIQSCFPLVKCLRLAVHAEQQMISCSGTSLRIPASLHNHYFLWWTLPAGDGPYPQAKIIDAAQQIYSCCMVSSWKQPNSKREALPKYVDVWFEQIPTNKHQTSCSLDGVFALFVSRENFTYGSITRRCIGFLTTADEHWSSKHQRT